MKKKKVGFWSPQLGERGTEVALYDYAYYNEKILGNKSYIFYLNDAKNNNNNVIQKFKKHFKVIGVDSHKEIDKHLIKKNIKFIYFIKYGNNDGVLSKVARNCVHCVFKAKQPHGDVYATIGPWVKGNNGKYPFVPHLVSLPNIQSNLKKELNIPTSATVFGGYGGSNNFNIKEAKNAVLNVASKNPNIYFLFANFNQFCESLPNIIHLPCIVDLDRKVEFINTCDAMIWARSAGETFGLAIAEFSTKNKPVIATKTGIKSGDIAHAHILGEKGVWYNSQKNLEHILSSFNKEEMAKKDWNAYRDYTPEKVMKIFDEVFLS